jgi:hypothetical protein
MLINSTAREQAPPVKIADCLTKFDLSMTEAKFLTDAYSVQKDIDPTSGGRFKPLTFLVDPGEASPEEIGELLAEVSKLYRMVGGSGITFSMTDVRRPEGVSV